MFKISSIIELPAFTDIVGYIWVGPYIWTVVVVVDPLVGVRSSRLWSTSQLIRPSGQQFSHSGGVCPQILYVGAVEEMMCVVYVSVTEGHSGDGYDLASTLCKYDLWKGD